MVSRISDTEGNCYLGQEFLSASQASGKTGGIGLSGEFLTMSPWGYAQAKPGEEFLKPGVGFLTRVGYEDYSFFQDYPVRPFTTEIKSLKDGIEFTQKSCRLKESVFNLFKSIELEGDKLIISSELENCGGDYLSGDEYCHNFLSFLGHGIVPGLEFNYQADSELLWENCDRNLVDLVQGDFSFKRVPEKEFFCSSRFQKPFSEASWSVRDRFSGLGVSCLENFPVAKMAIWGTAKVFSPEAFHEFTIEPGMSLFWQRVYRFANY